jgi:hypothetical protein
VRRLIVILAVAAIMAATMLGTALTASAQVPGAPTCGPWQQARYVSASGWPYFWWWRWCINYSVAPEDQSWYVDWAGWEWG